MEKSHQLCCNCNMLRIFHNKNHCKKICSISNPCKSNIKVIIRRRSQKRELSPIPIFFVTSFWTTQHCLKNVEHSEKSECGFVLKGNYSFAANHVSYQKVQNYVRRCSQQSEQSGSLGNRSMSRARPTGEAVSVVWLLKQPDCVIVIFNTW